MTSQLTRRTRASIALVATFAAGASAAVLVAQNTTNRPQAPTREQAQQEIKKAATPGQDHPAMQLPPGWTQADMQACIDASTPGPMHAFLAKGAGVWQGKNTMWMAPDSEPMVSECIATVKPLMDGRYVSVEFKGDMPGMGPFTGYGVHGYDNVADRFVSSWIDNHSTGIMQGTGELSSDGSTLTWNYSYTCPITKKPAKMREIERVIDDKTKTLEMWGSDPKSGREYRMMKIELTRKS